MLIYTMTEVFRVFVAGMFCGAGALFGGLYLLSRMHGK